ncbi:unnamed protein product [Rhizoctonia solani]|uniref:Transmembrane protein n=1 Tax=Rhizoctonia solani TaxID=456999 RepID=A0A8H3C720_9AGAM|nr:unnamed protein product [Rhizoctonia solani]
MGSPLDVRSLPLPPEPHLSAHFTWDIVTSTIVSPVPSPNVRPPDSCRHVVYLYTYGCSIATDIITGVLVLRCWALYSSRRVLWALGMGLVCTTTCTIVIASQIMKAHFDVYNQENNIYAAITPRDTFWVHYAPT